MEARSLAEPSRLPAEPKREGVIEECAVVGAIAALFCVEATPTFDLDVAVPVPQPPGSALFSLDGLDRALAERDFRREGPPVT